MRELAYNSGQVPTRYQVEPNTLKVEDNVIAAGGFADIRRGRLGERTVAVKTLRTGWKGNPQDAQKVRVAWNYFPWRADKRCTQPSVSARNASSG